MTDQTKDIPTDLEISVEEAKELLVSDNRTIPIDIRGSREIYLGYIRGARFVPPGLIEGELNKLSSDRSGPIIVYCAVGDRSVAAARKLKDMGFSNARSLRGGYDAWLGGGGDVVSDSRLTVHQLNRYSRNMLLEEIGKEGQLKLLDAKVLIVGAGGLASSAVPYFAAAGVGTMGIVDFDRVDLSNLNRQVVHSAGDVGRLKVDSLKETIERINPDVKVISYNSRLTSKNAVHIIDGFDVVMDATDNLDTKFLLNDASYFLNKPYVFGGAVQFDGQAGVFWPKKEGPCLRCLFREPPPRSLTPT
ncbi:MAG: ThiF family adenylyltransferase [Syntrophobacterales bacterium]|jgi:molybdopterin/thiamine biosynthesis adenylyltransferase/rhodanese-related sulfurtransferase|nr:ThiF family adenylyltransferase [Syntrophobacterales bacterium]